MGRRRWCICGAGSCELWGGEKWKTEIFWGIYSCMCHKPVDEKVKSDALENEWKEEAGLVYRFRSTFSWKEDSCCFPLSPCLTVWIHYANPSIGPTFIILTFPLQGSDWHQSGSSSRSSVRRWRCHSLSVRGRLPRDRVWVNKIKMRIN